VGEQAVGAEPAGVRGGEDRDEDAQAERPAELVRDVDQAGGGAGVLGSYAGDAGGGQRAQRGTLAAADQHHRQGDAG
jgi:hypothetical protein